jgi:diguanylate cyclase (GGDEF)-like protein
MLDIDHFKAVNDRFGHSGGDRLLTAFGRTIADLLRPQDIFARLGGEEFSLVLPGASSEQAEAIAERIRAAVEELGVATDAGTISVTVSIGLTASGRHPSANFENLLLIADQALYQAKMQGRNKVVTT